MGVCLFVWRELCSRAEQDPFSSALSVRSVVLVQVWRHAVPAAKDSYQAAVNRRSTLAITKSASWRCRRRFGCECLTIPRPIVCRREHHYAACGHRCSSSCPCVSFSSLSSRHKRNDFRAHRWPDVPITLGFFWCYPLTVTSKDHFW